MPNATDTPQVSGFATTSSPNAASFLDSDYGHHYHEYKIVLLSHAQGPRRRMVGALQQALLEL
ncbi:hypothetical protein CJU73_22895 [Pseudomonas fragi]|nr:hypothetical protein CJU73_22895 [Pseudomonas fragi]